MDEEAKKCEIHITKAGGKVFLDYLREMMILGRIRKRGIISDDEYERIQKRILRRYDQVISTSTPAINQHDSV